MVIDEGEHKLNQPVESNSSFYLLEESISIFSKKRYVFLVVKQELVRGKQHDHWLYRGLDNLSLLMDELVSIKKNLDRPRSW